MNTKTVLLFVVLGIIVSVCSGATTTTSYVSVVDKARLKQVLSVAWDLRDVAAVNYAVSGYKILGEQIPKQEEVCKFLLLRASDKAATLEDLYHVTNAWKSLGKCTGSLPVAAIAKTLTQVSESETSTVPELYFAVQGLTNLNQKKGDASKLIKTLQAALKKDDSLLNLGYSFHIAAHLGTDGTFAFDRIEDAIVQADEVDSRFLQFEGGLSITALLVNGAYQLASTVNKPPPITGDQAIKFANYFLSRRSVQTTKGVYNLLEVLNVLTKNKFHLPVAITLASQAAVSLEQPHVTVKVSDLLGHPLSTSPLIVTAESATRVGDEVVVLSKKKFEPTKGDTTLYTVNLMETKPERGFYKLTVSAALPKPDPRLVGNVGASLAIKVMTSVSVENTQVGTADADQTTQAKLATVAYPSKLSNVLEADTLQKLMMKFVLKDKSTGKPMTVHQAFVKLTHKETSSEIILVAEPDSSKTYKLDLDVGLKAGEFGHLGGLYSVELLVGDAVLTNPFSWHVADVKLRFQEQASPRLARDPYLYAPRPEIQHLFREPERRPPATVSSLFTALVGLPLLVLLVLWARLGVNVSNFPCSPSAVLFHIGLAAIFSLFGVFWLRLDMFQTVKYLLGLGVVTFLSGNKLLAHIAKARTAHG
ncbi:dolichyl-diphosphooligosaccharide--protein glycosyltransferase subunit 2 [Bacillus rossius redtenbacheri]|uniref:dolichyl-diphosphooligosaccharide--protein glycosyltransferase subunit 2 n=1 Tax=Bacillus rossius redtenbacheri TaxID=93214 RepID=UPI002FDE26F5